MITQAEARRFVEIMEYKHDDNVGGEYAVELLNLMDMMYDVAPPDFKATMIEYARYIADMTEEEFVLWKLGQ